MQSNSMLQKRVVSTRTITITAVLTAIIFMMTFLPRIPIPMGYAHLGDAIIFLTILFAERRESAVAASVGSALADLIGGFPIWVVPTLLIKWIMVELIFTVIRPERETWRILSLRTCAAFLLAAAWMVFSYTAIGGILYGSMAAGTIMIPGLIGEMVINIIVALAAGTALQKLNFH